MNRYKVEWKNGKISFLKGDNIISALIENGYHRMDTLKIKMFVIE